MLQCSKTEVIMPRNGNSESSTVHNGDSSFVSLLSGWVQQGVENLFATQRILVDLAMTQNANAMNLVRSRLADPEFCPAAVLTELAGEGMTNFIEGQKLLLGLAKKEYELVTTGVKERVGGSVAAVAATELMQRGFDTFIEMHQEFLKIASKQTHTWLAAVKAGKPYETEGMVEMAREAMETFVRTQKKFLDVVAEETSKATSGREPPRKTKKTDVTELAKEATDALIEVQKKMIDVAGRQLNANVKAATRAVNMVTPLSLPIPDLTREGVKNFVSAEKALLDSVMHRGEPKTAHKTTRGRKRPHRTIKVEPTHATA